MIPISDKLSKMINEQAGRELGNSLLYKHFASYAHTKGLKNIEKFFLGESEGEVGHHNLLIGLLNDGNVQLAIPDIPAKPSDFKDCLEVANSYVEAEAETTEHLEEIYRMAEMEKSIGVSALLQDMLREQIEEEGSSDRFLSLAQESSGNMLLLDLMFDT